MNRSRSDARAPVLLGGGMAVGISSAALVRQMSNHEIPGYGSGLCLGITSGTAAANILTRRLQLGDTRIREALDALAQVAPALENDLNQLHERYFVAGGKPESRPYAPVRLFDLAPPRMLQVLAIAGNFTAVWECKHGHDNPVGINYLQKIELSQIPALYGAVLAGVDYVCVGAGNPASFPEYLRRLSHHERVEQQVHVGRASRAHPVIFDPREFTMGDPPALRCPRFIAIVTTYEQAEQLANDEATRPYGFVFEGPTAGGHNAPPAGYQRFKGEPPQWGPIDEVDLTRLSSLRQPFWLAGGRGCPQGLREALAVGAAGVQFGTTLAFSNESGMTAALRQRVLDGIWHHNLEVVTEPLMSPTGFPFKVARLAGTISEAEVREARESWACCDLGQLITPIETKRTVTTEGASQEVVEVKTICPAEPLGSFTNKGGLPARRKGSICLCNGLMSAAGYPAVRGNGTYLEPPIVTIGDESIEHIRDIQKRQRSISYPASAAISYVLQGLVDYPEWANDRRATAPVGVHDGGQSLLTV